MTRFTSRTGRITAFFVAVLLLVFAILPLTKVRAAAPQVRGFTYSYDAATGLVSYQVTFDQGMDTMQSSGQSITFTPEAAGGASAVVQDGTLLSLNAQWSASNTVCSYTATLVMGNVYTVTIAGFGNLATEYSAGDSSHKVYLPSVTGLAADKTALETAGGTVTATITGGGLADTYMVGAFAGTATTPAVTATASGGTSSARTAALAIPGNTGSNPMSYTLKYSVDGTTWVAPPTAVVITVAEAEAGDGAVQIDTVTVSKTMLMGSGESVTIEVAGANIPETYLMGVFTEKATEPAAIAPTSGGDPSQRTATLDMPVNMTKVLIEYTLKYSADGGATWLDPPSPITLVVLANASDYDPSPVVDSIVVDPVLLDWQGGGFNVTITGKRLPKTVNVVMYIPAEGMDSAIEFAINSFDPNQRSGYGYVPSSHSEEKDIEYVVFVSIVPGKALSDKTAKLTVSKAINYSNGGSTGSGAPATIGQGNGKIQVAHETDPVTGLPILRLTGNRSNVQDILLINSTEYSKFAERVEWTGTPLTEGVAAGNKGQYISARGSTIIRLHAGFVRTQGNGVHRVRVFFDDGYADYLVDLQLDDPAGAAPQTGDATTAVPYAAVVGLGLVTLVLLYRGRRRQAAK